MRITNAAERAERLKAGQALLAKGSDMTEADLAAAEQITEEVARYDAGVKGRDMLNQLGKSATSDGQPASDSDVQYLDLGGKGHSAALLKAMKEQKALGQKALVTSGSVVVGTPLLTEPLVTLGRPLKSFLQAIPSVERPASYSWLAQSVRTENAAVVPSGGLKPTSTVSLVKKEGRLRVIATLSEPIDKFVLEDNSALGNWVSLELTGAVQTALEAQVLSGDGVGDNLTGLANTSGIQVFTSAVGNTDKLVEMRKAVTKLETAGESPAVFILNPGDWEGIATKRNASGEFDTGSAIDPEKRTAWGVPVSISTSLAANSYYLLGENAAVIGRDASIHTEWATPGDMFQRNQVQARTEGRFNLEVVRPVAVLKGTFVTA